MRAAESCWAGCRPARPVGMDATSGRSAARIVTAARVDGKRPGGGVSLLFARDYPECETQMQAEGSMGMSYELADAHVWFLQGHRCGPLMRWPFTDAAILLREKATYQSREAWISAAVYHDAAGRVGVRRHGNKVV